MVNLTSMAARLASKGIVVSLDVRAWNGMLPARPEWGAQIRVIHDRSVTGLREAKNALLDNLYSASIPSDYGNFLPNNSILGWSEKHDQLIATFDLIRTIVLNDRNRMVESAKSMASILSRENWAFDHGDEPPPPSVILHSSSLAASLVPSADDLREMFYVVRLIRDHSFLFPISDARCSFVGDGERRHAAWITIDELVAGNARRLKSWLESAVPPSNKWTQRYSDRTLKAATEFLATDLMPELGLSQAVKSVEVLLDRVPIENIDGSGLSSAVESAIGLAGRLSSVSGVLEILQ